MSKSFGEYTPRQKCGVILFFILPIALLGMEICGLVFGVKYKEYLCSQKLQQWLIVSGSLGIGLTVFNLVSQICQRKGKGEKLPGQTLLTVFVLLIALAKFGWLIYGTVMIKKSSADVCYADIYKMALASVIIQWTFPAFLLIVVCCAFCACTTS